MLNMTNLVVMTTSTWTMFNRKLSMEHGLSQLLRNWYLRSGIWLTTIGESMTLLRRIPESFYLQPSTSPDRSFWIFFFIRIIILIILSLEPWVIEEPKIDEGEKEKEGKATEKKESFLSCVSYLYRMRAYFLPSTSSTKICFGLLVALVGLDSLADFLSSYYYMKMRKRQRIWFQIGNTAHVNTLL